MDRLTKIVSTLIFFPCLASTQAATPTCGDQVTCTLTNISSAAYTCLLSNLEMLVNDYGAVIGTWPSPVTGTQPADFSISTGVPYAPGSISESDYVGTYDTTVDYDGTDVVFTMVSMPISSDELFIWYSVIYAHTGGVDGTHYNGDCSLL